MYFVCFLFKEVFILKNIKYKHLSFEDRVAIQEFLNLNFSFSLISCKINKHRTTISKEVFKHRFLRKRVSFSNNPDCKITSSAPYVCNGCSKKAFCNKNRYSYEASVAHNQYKRDLADCRSKVFITKDQIEDINEVISPLMILKHHSVNHVYISHPELLPFSKSTFYRYIDFGILNVRNIDLQRKVRFRLKKEYDTTRFKVNPKIKLGRFYSDFNTYIEFNPNASIVEMDTVIGTAGGKGGKCFLTLMFRKFHFMLIYILPYKRCEFVIEVFNYLKSILGIQSFSKLFEVILTDNGSEFSDPLSLEIEPSTGEKLINLFFCDSNCSWQKGSLEKNHEYIRYILPKGSSFAGLNQKDCDLISSHINAVPRVSLNNSSPFDLASIFLGKDILDKLNISFVEYDDINLSTRLLRK